MILSKLFSATSALDLRWYDSLRETLTRPLGSLAGSSVSLWTVLSLALVLIATWALARFVEQLVKRAAERRAASGSDYPGAYAFGRLSRYLVWIAGMVIALEGAGLNLSSFAFVGGAIGLGVGFGLQNMVSNFVSGIIVLLERSLKVGDFVDLQSGVRGHVREIALRYTRVTTNDSVDVLVPNSEFVNGRVTNWTFDDASRRIHVPFGVAYGSDKDQVKAAGVAAAQSVDGVICTHARRKPDVWMVGFGESALQFELVVWVPRELLSAPGRTQARLLWALDNELRARGIEVPFPQRDLHLRSGPLDVRLSR